MVRRSLQDEFDVITDGGHWPVAESRGRPGPRGFCAGGLDGWGEARRGTAARLWKSRPGQDFCGRARPSAEPVWDIFAPAGRQVSVDAKYERNYHPPRPVDASSKTGNVARKATAPTVRRRLDTVSGGAGREHDPRTCVCVCVWALCASIVFVRRTVVVGIIIIVNTIILSYIVWLVTG